MRSQSRCESRLRDSRFTPSAEPPAIALRPVGLSGTGYGTRWDWFGRLGRSVSSSRMGFRRWSPCPRPRRGTGCTPDHDELTDQACRRHRSEAQVATATVRLAGRPRRSPSRPWRRFYGRGESGNTRPSWRQPAHFVSSNLTVAPCRQVSVRLAPCRATCGMQQPRYGRE